MRFFLAPSAAPSTPPKVVGEIYDEDDEEDFVFAEDSIIFQEDGTFLIRGDADLEDVDAVLGLSLDEEEVLKEYGTLSGFLCFCAGEIPRVGDFVMSRGWSFKVVDADEKRVFQVKVERLLGFYEGEDGEDGDENLVRGFFHRKNAGSEEATAVEMDVTASMVERDGDGNGVNGGVEDGEGMAAAAVEASTAVLETHPAVDAVAADLAMPSSMTHAEVVTRQARVLNTFEVSRVERLVEQNEMKAAAVKEIIAEMRTSEDDAGVTAS